MKKFGFKYEKILNIRKEMENEIKNQLAIEIQKNIILNNKLDDNFKKQKEYLKFINDKISNGLRASELRQFNNNKEYYKREISQLKMKIVKQKSLVLAKRQELNAAIQETKKYEKMKEKQFDIYVAAMQDKERKEVEEIINYKNYKMSGGKNGE